MIDIQKHRLLFALSVLMMCLPFALHGTITEAEYFFDNDDIAPGLNTPMDIDITDEVAMASANNISTSGLSTGLHMIYCRLYDDNYGWGPVQGNTFLIATPQEEYSITAGEYFIDENDEGPGGNTALNLNVVGGIATGTATNIATNTLSAGIHVISSRFFAENHGWGPVQGNTFFITTPREEYSITAGEYFIDDNDDGPGENIGLNLNVVDGIATGTATNIATTTLSAGMHVIYSRFYAANHGWGPVSGHPFFITSPMEEYQISAGEYFIDDADAGPGNNEDLTVSNEDGVATGTASSIETDGLEPGIHIIYARMFADGSGWGAPLGYPFFVADTTTAFTISAAEYFVDTDPGFGAGTSLTLNGTNTNVSVGTDFDLTDATPGVHRLFIRMYSPEAGWGPTSSAMFIVESTEGTEDIVFIQSAQYYIGDDPESATLVTIESPEDGDFDELNETIALSDVSIPAGVSGLQNLGLRFQHSNGEWGAWRTTRFFVEQSESNQTIMAAEYFIDVDPGVGEGVAIEAPEDGAYDEAEEEFDLPVSAEGLDLGGHVVYLRLQRGDGQWGPARGNYFVVSEDAQPTIAAAEYYINPTTPAGGGIPFSALDGAFNTTEEAVQASASMASVGAQDVGNYTLFVRFMNSKNAWGPVSSQPFTVETRPQITSNLDTLDFGAMFIGEFRTLSLTISNIGDADLDITGLDFTDAAYTTEWTGETILPSNSVTFDITFTPLDPEGAHPAILTIANNDVDKQIVLQGVGLDTAPVMTVSQDSLDFGTVHTISSATQSVRISNIGNEDLVLSGVTSTDAAFYAPISNPNVIPGEYVDVDITFDPSAGQTYTDTVYLISNDTYFPAYPIHVTGIGSVIPVPDIYVTRDTLAFGNVALDDEPVQITLNIHNGGNEVLNISNISIDEPAFTSSLTGAQAINPSAFLPLSVTFTPTESKRYSGELVIFNDDPDSPQITLTLSGSSVFPNMILSSDTYNFGEIGVTTSSNQSLIVTNLGSDTLKISAFQVSSSLDTVVTISPSSFNINPAGGQRAFTISFTPAIPVEYVGEVVILSNTENDTLHITGTGVDDEPPTIAFDPDLIENVGTSENTAIGISAPITDNNQISWVRLYYRQGGKAVYDSTDMEFEAGLYSGEIPSAYVQNRGVEYYIKAFDGANEHVMPATAPDVPAIVRVTLPSLPPKTFIAEEYDMISVPSDMFQKNVKAVLEQKISGYDINDWRLFRWINGTYVELSENDNFTFEPGNAYWLITGERQVITLDSSISVKTNEDYLISLDQGWNQVGTPYYFPVSWSDVYAASPGVVQGSIAYEWLENEWQPATVMQPFGGYFISTFSGGSILRFPPRESVSTTAKRGNGLFALEANEWVLQISAENGENRDRYNYIGVFNDAENSGDISDQPKPPPMYPDRVQLYSEHKDWGELNGIYSGDFQAVTTEGNSWTLTLETGQAQEDILLSLDQSGDLPEGHMIKVLNLDLRYALRENDDNQFTQKVFSSGASYRLKVLVGDENYLASNDEGIGEAPTRFNLSQNYPNPFNGHTRIKFDIPEPTGLKVVIYDMTGRQVKELIHSDAHPVGYHEISWEGKNDRGLRVASGIYLINFQSAEYQATRKMVHLK